MSTASSTESSNAEPGTPTPGPTSERPDEEQTRAPGRFGALVDRFAPALGAYAVVKATGLTVFMMLLSHTGDFLKKDPGRGGGAQPWDVLGTWDGIWYQRIAENGYNPQLIPVHGFPLATYYENSAAFFPLYPWLMRLVGAITGLGPYGSGIVVSVLASFVAVAGIFAVAERLGGFRAGVIAAVVWGLFPGSGVEWAVYSDSLFVALSAWACYCVMTRRWVAAGLLTLAAGLNRPTAAALIAAVSIAALVALIRRTDGVKRPLFAMLITPWGLIWYVAWVGYRMGDWGGYFKLQRGAWNRYFDWGASTFRSILDVVTGHWNFWQSNPAPDLIAIALLIALPGLLVLLLRLRPPLVLVIYTMLTIFTALSSNQIFDNISRYLLPAFPLCIGLAVALRRVRTSSLVGLFVMPAIAAGWYAGYALFELGIP
ncbi:glycosyltransferase family 39 protein [Kitasatospora aureofaciens]|uniref:glycosyltransferase family 39 protein n=1 Tax=Kitasatospora aureofaciens TaxID=1894 RepID=UPI001C47C8F1|nr:glycosyltransferase family 39 protein [Kitasatospora aureofaciens]MBV6696305.1 glycosyltransferase family 39 protein [Kitasatospora aureofaciens]